MHSAVSAELALVPIIKHDDCDKCLHIGRLLLNDMDILPFSTVKISVSRQSTDGLYIDDFTKGQLATLIDQANELHAIGVEFMVPDFSKHSQL